MPEYSPLPYCSLSISFSCLACDEGYLLKNGNCYPGDPDVSCSIPGCSFCLSDNMCEACRPGFYTVENSGQISCDPMCDVDNCFQCQDNYTCEACDYGYVLDENQTACNNTPDDSVNCSDYHGEGCDECNSRQCFSCMDGYQFTERNGYG